MKKFILFLYCFLFILIFTTQPTFAAPPDILSKQLNMNNQYQQVLDLIDKNEYKQAINSLEQITDLDQLLIIYNNKKFNTLLKEYKNILINEVQQLSNNTFALNLLNSKYKYYKNDKTINLLIEQNKQYINSKNLVEYTGPIEHLYTHPLIAFPSVALNQKNPNHKDLDSNFLTTTEFTKIIHELYNNNYILIDIDSIYCVENGTVKQKPLLLPQGKKPLILSFDNVNYTSKNKNSGLIDKIILDRNKNIATYTSKQSIAKRVSYDNEFVTILESFIKDNPDFSFNGARGVICLTGHDGILGYSTQKSNATSRYEQKKALQVITKLKALGWKFANHSYFHNNINDMSDMEFAKDISNWKNEVLPLVGKTNIFTAPYGKLQDENKTLNYKHNLLIEEGYCLFLESSMDNYFDYSKLNNNILIMNYYVVNYQ